MPYSIMSIKLTRASFTDDSQETRALIVSLIVSIDTTLSYDPFVRMNFCQ